MRKPLAPGEAIACERQAEVFQHRCSGREVLHGSAVHLPWGILCVCGESGVGKSTLAVALSRRAHAILADDDIVLCEEAGTQRLSPNYFGSRLTEKSADLLGLKEPGTICRLSRLRQTDLAGIELDIVLASRRNACHLGIRHSRSGQWISRIVRAGEGHRGVRGPVAANQISVDEPVWLAREAVWRDCESG